MSKRILILGGTGDARAIAGRLVEDGHHVVSSLAGVTAQPVLPAGDVRVGGFGGAAGIVRYVGDSGVDVVVDATHPFATRISANAIAAAQKCAVPYVRFLRPAWQVRDGERWISVRDTAAAVAALEPGAVALVTIGRKEIGAFAVRRDVRVVARMIEAPADLLPDDWQIILAHPPFSLDDEIALMRDSAVSVLVTKNAGGAGRAKLDAAHRLVLPVIMIERPREAAMQLCETIENVAALVAGKES